jgi:hypothetical protein
MRIAHRPRDGVRSAHGQPNVGPAKSQEAHSHQRPQVDTGDPLKGAATTEISASAWLPSYTDTSTQE